MYNKSSREAILPHSKIDTAVIRHLHLKIGWFYSQVQRLADGRTSDRQTV